MFGFLKGLFGDGKPKPKPKTKAPGRPAAPQPKAAPQADADPAENRATLLRRARDVHRAKRKILDHLSDEDRAKLVGMAILTFLNQGREPDDKKR